MTEQQAFIYDWNMNGGNAPDSPDYRVTFADETLRDGLQSPSVRNPSMDEKLQILQCMENLQIDTVDIGLPGAGQQIEQTTRRLAMEIQNRDMNIRPYCAARTLKEDITPIVDISEQLGNPLQVATFIGSSPIRQYVEGWDIDELLTHTEQAVSFCRSHNLPVMYVTEDTTRAQPEHIQKLYSTAIKAGAERITLCDTVGHVIPEGVHNLITFVREEVVDPSGEDVKIDFHGHNDRGLAVANSIAAIKAGADQIHASALGIGERIGNTPMDQLLVNVQLLGWIERDLSELQDYCESVSQAVGRDIPDWYPMIGEDAFQTGTGIHAAAVIKALKKGDSWLADRVYSGVPAAELGREQNIRVGPMSGRSNAQYWLVSRGIEPDEELIEKIVEAGKQADHLLKDEEIWQLIPEEQKDH